MHSLRIRNNREGNLDLVYFPNDYNNTPTYFDDHTDTGAYGEENISGPE